MAVLGQAGKLYSLPGGPLRQFPVRPVRLYPHQKVKARIRALEERGVIEEYTTIVNPQRISGAVSCYFEIEVEPAWFPRVVDTLRDNETVTQIYQVSGNNKLHVHAVAAGQEELEAFLDGVIHRLPGVTGLSCNIILSRIKDIKGLRL